MVKFPSEFDTPDHSPGFLLWQLTNRWQREQRAALAPLGLTHVQFVLLAVTGWLEYSGNEATQALLAEHACTDPMMTSQVIRVLEKKGLVLRKRKEKDQRQWYLSLTTRGKKLLIDSLQVVESVDRALFGRLDTERAPFTTNLKKLCST